MKSRVFKYLVHVKGISYEEPKTWGSQLNQAEGKGEQDNKQGGDWEEESWNYQEALSALVALKGKGKGKGKAGAWMLKGGVKGLGSKGFPQGIR